MPVWSSEALVVGTIYTRASLKEKFAITAASLNNGIFQESGLDSIWLFITKNKTSDRTQYADELVGDTLKMESQPLGRLDVRLASHQETNTEILLFYRESKFQYAGAGFKFEGTFVHVSHTDVPPRKFVFQRA